MSPTPSRRRLLQALGLGSGSLFLPSLGHAQEAAPKRFLLLYTAQGCAPQRWECNPGALPDDADWFEDWTTWSAEDFSSSLAPLRPWAAHCTAVGGLGLVSCANDGSGFHHERAKAHGPTGADAEWIAGLPYGGAASIDQIIAAEVARADHFRSLELSVEGGLAYDGQGGSALYRGAAQPLPTIDNPAALWERLYGAQIGSGDPVLARQSSVLDMVSERFSQRAQSLSAVDRQKLEAHGALVRDLEQRLMGVATASCERIPDIPADDAYEEDFESHLQLVASAFSCDLTRVASIQMTQLTPSLLGLPPGSMHDSYAHGIYYDPDAEDAMATYMAFHARQLTRALEVLSGIPEAGGSMLDNTVILWITELADSWHGMDRYPVVVAGGANSGLQLGRYVHHARLTPFETVQATPDRFMGVPHNRLLVTVARAMGLDLEQVGRAEIPGWDGSTIDCTGALPMVLA
ncbi:MAG: hypothetical protein CL927_00575 [Deltaproteobacteria bacterium]|nr:hypothetical protein [Deltaproteobacteria bacterium]HCH66543.1 hypothetical protein [Deltaproteobacteria bacterium]